MSSIIINMVVAILTEPSQCHFEYMIVMPYRNKSQEANCLLFFDSFTEYGATVWDPYQKYNSDKVERVQR